MCLFLDNTTAIAYINHMGGRILELNELAQQIWLWCLNLDIKLTAAHIPGVQNEVADFESRHFNDRGEWSLDEGTFNKLIVKLGVPEIDLFASRLNAKCIRYVSWQRDPQAEFIDAFSQAWTGYHAYIFPPFSVIGKVLQKIRQENATALVVVPLWATQPWLSNFLKLLIRDPILLPQREKLLSLKHDKSKLHPLRKKLRLVAGLLSGKRIERHNYHSKLPALCSAPGNQGHTNSTLCMSENGMHFVTRGKLITLHHL